MSKYDFHVDTKGYFQNLELDLDPDSDKLGPLKTWTLKNMDPKMNHESQKICSNMGGIKIYF